MRNEGGRLDVPKVPAITPSVYLLYNFQWNDYGHKTNFHAYYFDSTGTCHKLGDVKILQKDQANTQLEASFTELDSNFCSLGESLAYYDSWFKIAPDLATEILLALRDVVADPTFADPFQTTDGWKNSILRFSEARKAYKEGGKYFGRRVPPAEEGFDFSFKCRLPGFSDSHEVFLNFTKKEELPYRVITFVGKNGTGKTGVLSRLSGALSGWDLKAGDFSPEPPQFSRVISISYSVFQPFEVPTKKTTSYRYCGLRNDHGQIDVQALNERTVDGLRDVVEKNRETDWIELMRLEDMFGHEQSENLTTDFDQFRAVLPTLSSGQRIIVSIVTEILQHITKQSLVLFDEPEVYLHPTLTSTLMRLLHELLERYDSYAVVATHSPIVVQEMPTRSVRVFERQGSFPMQGELSIESFGENLTEIVDNVFSMNDDDKNYKSIFEKIARERTYEELLVLFDDRLGLNARMTLLAYYKKMSGDK